MDNERKFIFKIAFKPQWVLSKRGDKQLPADRISDELKKTFNISDLSKAMTECKGKLTVSDDTDIAALQDKLSEVIKEVYGEDRDFFMVTVQEAPVEEPMPEKTEEAASPAEEPAPQAAAPAAAVPSFASVIGGKPAQEVKGKSTIEKIDELVGADAFKALCHEIVDVAEALKTNNVVDAFICRNYLFSIDNGYGLSTYLKLFADLVSELGLLKIQETKGVQEHVIPFQTGDMQDFKAALDSLNVGMSGGKVLCFDISDWMNKTFDKHFRNFLSAVNDKSGSNIIFFRVPFLEKGVLDKLHKGINDQLFLGDIIVVPFTMDQLDKAAGNVLSEKNYSLDEDALELFHSRIVEEKSDGRFYGMKTVRKIVDEMLYDKQISSVKKGEFTTVITAEDVSCIAGAVQDSKKTGMEMLDELVGMDKIKHQVLEIVSQIEAALANEKIQNPCIHMRFVGNPGTGKTTVARIIGKILAEKGILRVGSFFEYGGRDFCGRYVGQTAPKTAAICRDAYGSVLFIDEAYTLYSSDREDDIDYGREAIDTLIAEMENHRSDFMVIMAGYPDEMEKLMTVNVGLRQRMPYTIEFPNYSKEQLAEIFLGMCRSSFTYDETFEEAVRDYFDKLSEDYLGSKQFSNGRYCRNLFERTWGKAVLRCQMAGMPYDKLEVEDFALAAEEKDFSNIIEKKTKKLGFN